MPGAAVVPFDGNLENDGYANSLFDWSEGYFSLSLSLTSLSLPLSGGSSESSPSSRPPSVAVSFPAFRNGERREGGSLLRLCPSHGGSPHDGYRGGSARRRSPPAGAVSVRLRGLVRRHGQYRQDRRSLLERALRRHLPQETRRPFLRRPRLHRLSRFPVRDQIAAPLQVPEVREEAAALRHELRRRRLRRLRRTLLPGQPDGADRPLPGAARRGRLPGRPRPRAVDGRRLHRRQRLHVLRRNRRHLRGHEEGVRAQADRAAEVRPEAAAAAGGGEGGGDELAPHRMRPPHVQPPLLQGLQRHRQPRRHVPQRPAGPGRVGAKRRDQRRRRRRHCYDCRSSLRHRRPPRRLHHRVKQRDEEEARRCTEAVLPGSGGRRQQLREHRRQRDGHVRGLRGAPAEVLLGHRPPHAGRLESRLLHARGFSRLPPRQLASQPIWPAGRPASASLRRPPPSLPPY